MRDIQDKQDNAGDTITAEAFNTNYIKELQELVESAGFTLDAEEGPDSDTAMLVKSIVLYSTASQYFSESGVADAYVLTRSGTFEPLSSYEDGVVVIFKPSNGNTGASTINVDEVGVKDLVSSDGSALSGGEIAADYYIIARYNSTSDDFEIVYTGTGSAADAEVVKKGSIATLSDTIDLDPSPSSNQTAVGITSLKTVDTNTVGFGSLLILSSDGNYDEANAGSSSTMPCTAMALSAGTGSLTVLKQGYVRDDSWSWTPGSILYVDTTAGQITSTAPSGSGEVVQIIGNAESSTVIYFNPEYTTIEIA